jgi:hypothetical protein
MTSASVSESSAGNAVPAIFSSAARAAARVSVGGLGGRRQVRDQVEVVQGPFEDVRGEIVADGQDLALGPDAGRGIGEYGGPAHRGTDVVQMELEQSRIAVRGGQPRDQRAQRVLAGRGFDQVPVRGRVRGRFGVGGCDQGDQDVLRVDDQVAHQVPYEPAPAAGGPLEVLVRDIGDRREQCGPGAREGMHYGSSAVAVQLRKAAKAAGRAVTIDSVGIFESRTAMRRGVMATSTQSPPWSLL